MMRFVLLGLFGLTGCINAQSVPAENVQAQTSCIEDRDALLSLDYAAFDQDLNGGWRAVSQMKGCEEEAADLLRDYRLDHPDA